MNGFKVSSRAAFVSLMAAALVLVGCGGGGGAESSTTVAVAAPVATLPIVTPVVAPAPVVIPEPVVTYPLALAATPAPTGKVLFVAEAEGLWVNRSSLYSLNDGNLPSFLGLTRWASTVSVSQKSGAYVFQDQNSATAYYSKAGVLLASYPDVQVAGVAYAWTPDGSVVFVSDVGLVEFNPTGVGQLLILRNQQIDDWDSSPAVSSDGKFLVVSHHTWSRAVGDSTTIYLAEMTKLREGLGLASAQVVWTGLSSDYDLIRNRTTFLNNNEFIFVGTTKDVDGQFSTKIFLGNVDGTPPKVVIKTPFVTGLLQIALSPDGTRIAYASLDRIVYLAKVGEWVVTILDRGYVGYKYDSLSWSPDGKYLAAGGLLSNGSPNKAQVVVYQPGTTKKWKLAEVDGAEVPGLAWAP